MGGALKAPIVTLVIAVLVIVALTVTILTALAARRHAHDSIDRLWGCSLSEWGRRLRDPTQRPATMRELCGILDATNSFEAQLAMDVLSHDPPRNEDELDQVLPRIERWLLMPASQTCNTMPPVSAAVLLREIGQQGLPIADALTIKMAVSGCPMFLGRACEALHAMDAPGRKQALESLLQRLRDTESHARVRSAVKSALGLEGRRE